MDLKTIKQLDEQANTEKWTYPQLFDALKQAGVTSYETNVPEFEIVYKTADDDIYTPIPKDWISLDVAPDLDESGVKEAIAQIGRHEITYPEFLAEIASSGVSSYTVDMEKRTITYKSESGQALIEEVPSATK